VHTIETRNTQCKRREQRHTWKSSFHDKRLQNKIGQKLEITEKKNLKINHLQSVLKMASEL